MFLNYESGTFPVIEGAGDGFTGIQFECCCGFRVADAADAGRAGQIPTGRHGFADRVVAWNQCLIVGRSRVSKTEVGITAATRVEVEALRITARGQ